MIRPRSANRTRPVPRATDAEIAALCQLALDRARDHIAVRSLPEVSRDFGHSSVILDRVASEHSATICERMNRARMRVVGDV